MAKNAVEFEIYWDKTATGLMYHSDLLSFTDHFRLAVLCSAPSYFAGLFLLTTLLGYICLLIFSDNFAFELF